MEAIVTKLYPTIMVALGGALGASCRFWLRELIPAVTGSEYPFSTLVVNVVGCFLAGLVFMWLHHSGGHWSVGRLLFFFVGFLGAFTTFSAFALDSLLLFNQGESLKLLLNISANFILSLTSVFVGAWLGGRIALN